MILNNIVRILNNISLHILDYSSCSNCFEKRSPRDSSFLQHSQGYISEHLYLCKVKVNNIFSIIHRNICESFFKCTIEMKFFFKCSKICTIGNSIFAVRRNMNFSINKSLDLHRKYQIVIWQTFCSNKT